MFFLVREKREEWSQIETVKYRSALLKSRGMLEQTPQHCDRKLDYSSPHAKAGTAS